jgi:hypothetical protein
MHDLICASTVLLEDENEMHVRTASVKALTHCEVCLLSRANYEELLQIMPHIHDVSETMVVVTAYACDVLIVVCLLSRAK